MNIARFLSFLAMTLMFISCGTEPDTTFYDVSVTVMPNDGGTTVPADSSYEAGSMINLQSTANDGFEFTGWSGDVESSDNPLSLTIDQDYSLTANFIDSDELFVLAENGVTIRCPEAEPGQTGTVNGTQYEAVDRELLDQKLANGADLSAVCTTPVTDMERIFAGATDFNGDIRGWDVSNVEDMTGMFVGATNFNGDISNWNVSNVISMYYMFHEAKNFNGKVEDWDVSSVTDMSSMFEEAFNFNRDINSWDVSNVTDMGRMFWSASSFNSSLDGWDTGNVTTMRSMFAGATSFNSDLNNWDVSSVTDMSWMFGLDYVLGVGGTEEGATSFNGDISSWDVRNVTDMTGMFSNAENFNQDLSGWCVQSISEEPSGFSARSPLSKAHHPIWGTCPE